MSEPFRVTDATGFARSPLLPRVLTAQGRVSGALYGFSFHFPRTAPALGDQLASGRR